MVYHIYNRSIAEFQIFNNPVNCIRMLDLMCYYRSDKPIISFSHFSKAVKEGREKEISARLRQCDCGKIVEIIAYCIMPTHLHLLLNDLKDNGSQIYISNILNGYTRFFNVKHKRKGPLWEGRSKRVIVESDEQLLHLTRYIHLNPVTAYLVDKPEDWIYSSYREYLGIVNASNKICNYTSLLKTDPISYRIFVNQNIEYQRELAKARKAEINLVGSTS